jgi:hypothetical protein
MEKNTLIDKLILIIFGALFCTVMILGIATFLILILS